MYLPLSSKIHVDLGTKIRCYATWPLDGIRETV